MEVFDKPSHEFWEGVLKNCQQATFFHSPVWLDTLVKTFPQYTNATLGFTFESGNRALIPLVADRSRGKIFKKFKHKSMPLGTYGGIISERKLSPEEHRNILEHLSSGSIDDLTIVGNPLEDYDLPEYFPAKGLFTHIISLDLFIHRT